MLDSWLYSSAAMWILAGASDALDDANARHAGAVAALEELGGRVTQKTSENGETYTVVNLFGRGKARWRGGEAGAEHLSDLHDLRELRVHDVEEFADGAMVHLEDLKGLRLLRLRHTGVTDRGLRHIAGLVDLEFLGLASSRFSDRALDAVAGLKRLTSLRLDETAVSDDGLARLKAAGLLEQLEFLSLSGSRVTGAGLVHLRNAMRLERLFLANVRLTDDDLRHIGGLEQLQVLTLGRNAISDAALAHLRSLESLDALYLDGTRLTDGAVPLLEKFARLRQLHLAETGITHVGYTRLVAALPACRISWERATPLTPGERPPPLDVEKWIGVAADGAAPTWRSLEGNVVVIEFWATWCAPCVKAIPHMNDLARRFEGKPVRFLAVTSEEASVVERFLARRPIAARVGLDTDRSMLAAFGVKAIPHTVVVNSDGEVHAVTFPAGVTVSMLEALMKKER